MKQMGNVFNLGKRSYALLKVNYPSRPILSLLAMYLTGSSLKLCSFIACEVVSVHGGGESKIIKQIIRISSANWKSSLLKDTFISISKE